jgi:hypothetical protein
MWNVVKNGAEVVESALMQSNKKLVPAYRTGTYQLPVLGCPDFYLLLGTATTGK